MGRRKKKPVETYESYPVRIVDWKVDYSLHLDKECRFSEGPFWEHYCLELRGEFLGPERIKGREVTIAFLADRELDQALTNPNSLKWEPKGVGGLKARGKRSDFIGSLPFQIFGPVLTTLQSGKIKYVIFNGNALRYGSASIKGITLTGEYDPDDY